MSKGKRSPVWVDSAKTRTAADVETPDACDAHAQRIFKDVQYIIDSLDIPVDIPRNAKKLLALRTPPSNLPQDFQNTLHFKKLALLQLRDRKRELLAQSTPSQ